MTLLWLPFVPVALAKDSGLFPKPCSWLTSSTTWAWQHFGCSESFPLAYLYVLHYSAVNNFHLFCISCLLHAQVGAGPWRRRPPLLGFRFLRIFQGMNGGRLLGFQRMAVTAWHLGQCSGRGQSHCQHQPLSLGHCSQLLNHVLLYPDLLQIHLCFGSIW